MKTLTFSTHRQPLLTFQAESTEFARDGEAFIVQASGEITFQDTPILEAFLHGGHACYLSVTEDGESLLHGRFFTNFLILEAEQLAVRLVQDTA